MKRTLVRISKNEAAQLRKMGVKNGENGIFTTSAHHHTNYLTETQGNIKKLNKLRHIDD